MKKRIFRYFKHLLLTLTGIAFIGLYVLLSEDGGIHYGDNKLKMDWNNEGPYVFYNNDSILEVNYIRGNQSEGFYTDKEAYTTRSPIHGKCYFPLDSTEFNFTIEPTIIPPPSSYTDSEKIIAISDIESSYKSFRDFLIHSEVINNKLEWVFEKGHLVLVGDFVDRGFSTTQVLWFIYKLEQQAKKHGGQVHFILGNHELKNLQGNYESAAPKYNYIAAILNKQQHQLYNQQSFLGRWLESKNSIELINGHLFTHGGLHPDITKSNLSLKGINDLLKSKYRSIFFPQKEKSNSQFLTSTFSGPSWYRGYFKSDITQNEVEKSLDYFNSKSIIVGHTIQRKVNKHFNGKVIAIDVQHPKDYHKNWPNRKSEGLYIDKDQLYRILHDGTKIKL